MKQPALPGYFIINLELKMMFYRWCAFSTASLEPTSRWFTISL